MTLKKKHFSPLLLIFLTVFIDLLGFGIIIPILPVISSHYPLGTLGAGIRGGILMSAFSILQMVFSPFWGRLSDHYGRRPILLLSLAGSTVSYFMFAFADSYTMLLVSRVLAGVCSANITAAQAYIADITKKEERTAGMGLIGMAFGLGFAFGPVLGGSATHFWHRLYPLAAAHMGPGLIAGAICGVNFIWALFKLPESLPQRCRDQVPFRRFATARETLANLGHPAIGPLIMLFFLVTFAFANLEVSFSLYAGRVLRVEQVKADRMRVEPVIVDSHALRPADPRQRLDDAVQEKIYLFFILLGLVLAIVQGVVVRRAVRVIPESTLIIPGLVLLALGLFLLPLGTSSPYLMATMILLAIGQGLSNPCIMSLISRSASALTQGNVMGTSQAASSLARILGPMFGGFLFDFGPRWPFWAAALLMTLAVGWARFTRRRLASHAAPTQATPDQGTVDYPV